ncbi:hypothetical protein ACTFIY_009344 [Dictyostelium cf. discoideum]
MEKKEIKHLHEKIKKTNLENKNKITNINNLYLQDTIIIIILRDIIDYLISNKIKYNNKNYSIKRYYLYKNEILNYSLVSNKWFDIISTIITNNLIENKGIGNWLLKPIISYEDTNLGNSQVKKVFSINYNHIGFINNLTNYYSPICNIEPPNEIKLEIGKKKSIIKINVNDIKKIFNFQDKSLLILNEFIDSFNNSNPNEYDKIIINISNCVLPDNEEVIKYLSNPNIKYKLNNENIEININKIFIDEENQVFSNLNENIALNNKMNVNKLNIVGCREYDFDDDDDDETSELYENEFNELKKLLLFLNPKHLKYSPNSCYPGSERFYHCDYSCLFNPDYNNSIISISIDYSDFVEPINLIRINELNNLRSISLPFLFHEMFKLNNNENNGNGSDHEDDDGSSGDDDDDDDDDSGSSSNNGININNTSSSYSCSLFKTIKHKDSVKQDWIEMINSISNTKSLRSITLKNYCKLFDTAKNNNLNEVDLISNGIQTIIKSLPNLKSLKLVDIDPHINPSIVFSTLLLNSTSTSITTITKTKNHIENYSINTLIIKSSFIPISELLINYLFRDLLSLPIKNYNYKNNSNNNNNNNNNKIRNLKLIKKPVDHKTSQLIVDNIKYLENNNLILNLYSLEFVIDISKINQILDLLNSKSLLLIKELNLIYMDNQDEIENIIFSLKSNLNSNNIINNKVINFIKL